MASPDRNHYDLLGIARDADADEVRRAWRMLVQVWHPDRFEGELQANAEEQASRINAAYHVLRDSGRRAAYDCRLAADERAAEPATPRRPIHDPFRPGSAPVGGHTQPLGSTRHAHATVAPGSTTDRVWAEIVDAVRRHPRIVGAAAAVWVVVFGGSMVLHAMTGPTLPAEPVASTRGGAVITASEQDDQLADLAEQARRDSAESEAAFREMLEQDAAIAEEPTPQADPRAGRAQGAPQLPRSEEPAEPAPRVAEITKPDGTRVLRVLPG